MKSQWPHPDAAHFQLDRILEGVCTSPVWDIMPQPKRPETELRDGVTCPCFEAGGEPPERGKQ